MSEVEELADKVFTAVSAYVDRRLAGLEKRLGEMEARGLAYKGVHQRAQSYRRGDAVTSEGALWIALTNTADQPGKSGDWQLAVQRGPAGRNGKDGRP